MRTTNTRSDRSAGPAESSGRSACPAHPSRTRRRHLRRGAAVVEMAIVTPLLLLMMFGIMEFGWMLMMKETLTNACREAARVRVLKGSTDTDARTRFDGAVTGTGLTVSPSQLTINSATQSNGDVIWTVQASVPRNQVSLFGISGALQNMMRMFSPGATLGNNNMIALCSMRQEG